MVVVGLVWLRVSEGGRVSNAAAREGEGQGGGTFAQGRRQIGAQGFGRDMAGGAHACADQPLGDL